MIQLDLGRVTAKTANFSTRFFEFFMRQQISHLLLTITITVFLETTRFYSDAATNIYTRLLVYNLTLKQLNKPAFIGAHLAHQTYEQILLLNTPTNFIGARLIILQLDWFLQNLPKFRQIYQKRSRRHLTRCGTNG